MGEESQEVKIIGINKEAIKSVSEKKERWIVSFTLSVKPDQSWEEKFYEALKRGDDPMGRKSHLQGNAMLVEVSAKDDLQEILDGLKITVAEANILCEEDYQKKLQIRRDLEELQKKQRDDTQKLKDDSDKLIF